MRSLLPFIFGGAAALAGLVQPRARAESAASAAPTAWSADRQLEEMARDLAAHFNLDGELQLALLRPWTPPAGTATAWQLELLEYPIQPTVNMLVRYRLRRDGAIVDESSLMVRAALWRDAWFARQPIRSGTTFGPALLESRRIDSLREHDGLPSSAGDPSYIFARDIPSDHLVTWHDLARRPLVHKGEVVEVVAAEGRLSLSMKALALENGARGDLVTVRNLESNKTLSAQVIDDSRVEIHF